ncbi:MAG: peptide chain release factor N(5)-glutamine methyltransferase [Oscillospiraceae bacterium]|nr:peptide chain release factor N(5)-glutamine methyltransferase [Oscillospiraceae bacterium]
MTIREALREGARFLESRGVPDPLTDAGWLLAEALELPRLSLALNSSDIAQDASRRYFAMIDRRASREPLQHIIGYVEFAGARLKSDARALIPRPETECLFELCAKFVSGRENVSILDMCTGSGALAVALARRFPKARVCASDASIGALDLAAENAMLNDVSIELFRGDLFDPFVDTGILFDVIACNPPYIPTSELAGLQPEVLREPRAALDGGIDGLDILRRVSRDSSRFLRSDGALFIEIGYGQSEMVRAFLAESYGNIIIEPDLSGTPRIIRAQF